MNMMKLRAWYVAGLLALSLLFVSPATLSWAQDTGDTPGMAEQQDFDDMDDDDGFDWGWLGLLGLLGLLGMRRREAAIREPVTREPVNRPRP